MLAAGLVPFAPVPDDDHRRHMVLLCDVVRGLSWKIR
jgi:hypothetical protein